ncbi:multidrug resistance protein 4 [Thelephora ganbajun]|uniref:Multidrug resistance protein 4 n=1 Tax=Thelephora ganbajun TaxID=370292 RepID=A0ACB6ZFA5_THEGA|nr:multidrug resistance protein 4 [Thelephora ganbajun]
MSDFSDSNAVEKDPMTSDTTLVLPHLGEAEKGFQVRIEVVGDPIQDTEVQFSAEKEIDPEDDEWLGSPAHPRNWPATKKWTNMAIVSFYTCLPPLTSSMMAPGLQQIGQHFHETNPTIIAMSLSIILLAWVFSPLIIAPLSEMYGRRWLYHISNLLTLAFSLGCAFAPTMGSLIGFRFLSGIASAAPLALGGGSVADLFAEQDRASAMAIYILGPLLGPVIGPVAGGFVVQTIGYKYVFIIIAAISGVLAVLSIPFMDETYAPVVRMKYDIASGDPEKARNARRHLGPDVELGRWKFLWVNLSRPVILLTHSFICFILNLYMALVCGIYFLMFATFSELFTHTYGFDIGTSGLAYLGLGIGSIIASVFGARSSDKIYAYYRAKNNGVGKPEMRIPVLIIGSLFVPVGLLWYGWSADAKIHWIMPIIGTAIYGSGLMTCFLPVTLYLIDAFTYAASVTSAATVFRNMLGFTFPLFGSQMYKVLGVGGGNSLLAALAVVIGIPFPVWIWYKGEELRSRNPLNR